MTEDWASRAVARGLRPAGCLYLSLGLRSPFPPSRAKLKCTKDILSRREGQAYPVTKTVPTAIVNILRSER